MFRLFIAVSLADLDECQRGRVESFEIRNSDVERNEGACYDNHTGTTFARHAVVEINSPTSSMESIAYQSRPLRKLKSLGASMSAPSSRRSSVDYRMRGGSVGHANSLKSCPIGTAVYGVHCKLHTRSSKSHNIPDAYNSERNESTDSRLRSPSLSTLPDPYVDGSYSHYPELGDARGRDLEAREVEWTVYYRYSQWRALFDAMRRDKALSQRAINLFPPKRLLSPGDDPEVVRERLTAFPQWLSAVTSDKRSLAHPAFRKFLKLDKYAPELTRKIQREGEYTNIPDVSYIGDLLQASPEFARYRDQVLAHHKGSPAAVLVPLPPLSRLNQVYDYPEVDVLDPLYSYEENVQEGPAGAGDTSDEEHYEGLYALNATPQRSEKPSVEDHYRYFAQRLSIVVPSHSQETSLAFSSSDTNNYSATGSSMKAPTPSAPPLYDF